MTGLDQMRDESGMLDKGSGLLNPYDKGGSRGG